MLLTSQHHSMQLRSVLSPSTKVLIKAGKQLLCVNVDLLTYMFPPGAINGLLLSRQATLSALL